MFPLASDLRRRTMRAPTNPLDKSTVISIYPKKIKEYKATIDPGIFEIEPGTFEKPAILVVGSSSWWKEVDDTQPLLEIPHSSIQVADSVVKDYCNGVFGCDMGESMPGLFFIPGAITVKDLFENKEYNALLKEANRKQRNWYTNLIRLGDALWTRSNGNPLSVSEDMRLAARELNMINKDWYKDNIAMELVRCKACGALINPAYPVCPTCKAINDPAKAKALEIQFAQ